MKIQKLLIHIAPSIEGLLHQLGLGDTLKFIYQYGLSAFFKSSERRSNEAYPIPPPYLIYLVIGQPNQNLFLSSGRRQVMELLLPMLQKQGYSLTHLGQVLDFGCGCGRMSRHLLGLEGVELQGCDINQKLVQWCAKNLSADAFFCSDNVPPLPLEDHSLSIVLARSVFTHLTEPLQVLWLNEFSRVLKPKGLLWITLSGDYYTKYLTREEMDKYQLGQMVVRNRNLQGSNDCAVFHPPQYAEALIRGNNFEILEMVPGNRVENALQDSYLCRKMS